MKDRRRRGQAENDENERGQNGGKRQKRRAVLVERRGQQDWKRPMLDRDQLLSPTCLVDSQIIARSLHGPGTRSSRLSVGIEERITILTDESDTGRYRIRSSS